MKVTRLTTSAIHPASDFLLGYDTAAQLAGNCGSTAHHSTSQHSTAQHSTAQHSMAQEGTACHGIKHVSVVMRRLQLGACRPQVAMTRWLV
jgi:hypothetical protein